MEVKKYIKGYSDKHAVVIAVIVCVLVWGFLGFMNRDRQITELESALTNTTDGDYFAVGCGDYLLEENVTILNQEQIDKICRDLAHVVDDVNENVIKDFHTRPFESEGGVCSGRYDSDC